MPKFRFFLASLLALATFAGGTLQASAASPTLTRNAWVPYWREAGGINEVRANFSSFTSISPFSFEVQADGTVVDKLGLSEDLWRTFLKDAERKNVSVYPTVSWMNGSSIHAVLSDPRKRANHIAQIMNNVIGFDRTIDGLEIDYEGKLADTNQHFSAFLTELSSQLRRKNKKLICDIEARTPLHDRYTVVTPAIRAAALQYANDYTVIGSVCDEVRIMAYDQGRVVLSLNKAAGEYYAPVSDVAWVAKVMASTTPMIPAKKIVMGIPTYGRVWRIESNGTYTQVASVNYNDAIALAAARNVPVKRGKSGELNFTYTGTTSGLPSSTSATPSRLQNRYFVSFSDAVSIQAHVDLAKKLGLGGVALFKLDGNTDPAYANTFFK